VLHKAGGKILLQHVIDYALELNYAGTHFRRGGSSGGAGCAMRLPHPASASSSQKEQKGTGDAVRIGRDAMAHLDGYLMVLYGDPPLLRTATYAA